MGKNAGQGDAGKSGIHRTADNEQKSVGSALGIRLHRFSYLVLAATVLFVPFLPFAPNGAFLFLLELFITLPHFLLLLYLCAADMNPAAKALYLWAHLVDPS